jgi:hypothetical protein
MKKKKAFLAKVICVFSEKELKKSYIFVFHFDNELKGIKHYESIHFFKRFYYWPSQSVFFFYWSFVQNSRGQFLGQPICLVKNSQVRSLAR